MSVPDTGTLSSATAHLAPFQSELEGRQPPGSQERWREPLPQPYVHWMQHCKRSLGRRCAINQRTPHTQSVIKGIVLEKQSTCLCKRGSAVNHRTLCYRGRGSGPLHSPRATSSLLPTSDGGPHPGSGGQAWFKRHSAQKPQVYESQKFRSLRSGSELG